MLRPPHSHWLAFAAVFCFLSLLDPLARAAPQEGAGTVDTAAGAGAAYTAGRALLVGVGEYPELARSMTPEKYASRIRLHGPARDVESMRSVLIDVVGFDPDSIDTFVGWGDEESTRPTRQNILAALDRLADEARSGELVTVYLAGHGSRLPDSSGEEADGLDEVFLPADLERWDADAQDLPGAIRDDEIGARVGRIVEKGARVWLVVDSCHSATLLRGADGVSVRYRNLSSEDLGVPSPASAAVENGSNREPETTLLDRYGDRVVAMYAAASYQQAIEQDMPVAGGEPHGVFTWHLTRQLALTGAGATFGELFDQIEAAFRAAGINTVTPQRSGPLEATIVTGARRGPALLVGNERQRGLFVNGGALHGLAEGDVLDVYERGFRGREAHRLGSVVVRQAELTRARVEVDGNSPFDPDLLAGDEARMLPVELSERSVQAKLFRVCVQDARGSALDPSQLSDEDRQWFESLPGHGKRFVLGSDVEAELFVRPVKEGAMWRILPARSGGGRPLDVDPDRLGRGIFRFYRAAALRGLSGDSIAGGIPTGVRVGLDVRDTEADDWRAAPAGERVIPGSVARLSIENESQRDWYVHVYWLDAELQPFLLFPDRFGEDAALIPAGGSWRGDPNLFHDTTLGVEELVCFVFESPTDVPSRVMAAQPVADSRGRTRSVQGTTAVFEDLTTGVDGENRTRGLGGRGGAEASARIAVMPLDVRWDTPSQLPSSDDEPVFVGDAFDLVRPSPRSDPEPFLGTANRSRTRALPVEFGDLYARFAPSIVAVRTRAGHGTGFLIDAEEGLLLTNHHVIDSGSWFNDRGRRVVHLLHGVIDDEGMMSPSPDPALAEIVASDRRRDLALLQVIGDRDWLDGRTAIEMAEATPAPGTPCAVIGHPSSGMLWTFRDGKVSAFGRDPHDMIDFAIARVGLSEPDKRRLKEQLDRQKTAVRILLSSCGVNPGDSGSPLVDAQGRFIAVTYAIPSDVRDKAFAYHIHLDEVQAFLEEARQHVGSSAPQVPDPWKIGPNAVWDTPGTRNPGKSDLRRNAQALRTVDGEQRTTVAIDFDADSAAPMNSADEVRAAIDAREASGLDFELILHFSPTELLAFYDRSGDGVMDLILVDNDPDEFADTRFELGPDGEWAVFNDVNEDWLSLAHIYPDSPRTPESDYAQAMLELRLILRR